MNANTNNIAKILLNCILIGFISSRILGSNNFNQKTESSVATDRLLAKDKDGNEIEEKVITRPAIQPVFMKKKREVQNQEIISLPKIDAWNSEDVHLTLKRTENAVFVPPYNTYEKNANTRYCPLDTPTRQRINKEGPPLLGAGFRIELPFSITTDSNGDKNYHVLNINFDQSSFETACSVFDIQSIPTGSTIAYSWNPTLPPRMDVDSDDTKEINRAGEIKDKYRLNYNGKTICYHRLFDEAFNNVLTDFEVSGREVNQNDHGAEETRIMNGQGEHIQVEFKIVGLRVQVTVVKESHTEKIMIGLEHLDGELENVKNQYNACPSNQFIERAKRLKRSMGFLQVRKC